MLETGAPPIAPERAIDAIERALEAGRCFAFSDWQSRAGFTLRRFVPKLLWSIAHRVEGI